MLSAIESIGAQALPYLIEAGKDIVKGFIQKSMGDAEVGSTEKTLGDCAEKVVDTIGNNRDVKVIKIRRTDRGRKEKLVRTSSNNAPVRLIDEEANKEYIIDQDNVPEPMNELRQENENPDYEQGM